MFCKVLNNFEQSCLQIINHTHPLDDKYAYIYNTIILIEHHCNFMELKRFQVVNPNVLLPQFPQTAKHFENTLRDEEMTEIDL